MGGGGADVGALAQEAALSGKVGRDARDDQALRDVVFAPGESATAEPEFLRLVDIASKGKTCCEVRRGDETTVCQAED
jgi:hypothetical protein